MSAILLAKLSMPGTMFWSLQQYMLNFCNNHVQIKYLPKITNP